MIALRYTETEELEFKCVSSERSSGVEKYLVTAHTKELLKIGDDKGLVLIERVKVFRQLNRVNEFLFYFVQNRLYGM